MQGVASAQWELTIAADLQSAGALGSEERARWQSTFEASLGNVLSIEQGRISVFYVRGASLAVGVDMFDT